MKVNIYRRAEQENVIDASSLPTAITLINDLKAKYNNLANSYNQLLILLNNREGN